MTARWTPLDIRVWIKPEPPSWSAGHGLAKKLFNVRWFGANWMLIWWEFASSKFDLTMPRDSWGRHVRWDGTPGAVRRTLICHGKCKKTSSWDFPGFMLPQFLQWLNHLPPLLVLSPSLFAEICYFSLSVGSFNQYQHQNLSGEILENSRKLSRKVVISSLDNPSAHIETE